MDTTATDLAGNSTHIRLSETPDICPRCHRSVHPKPVTGAMLTQSSFCQFVFRCTNQKCQEMFIATYLPAGGHNGRSAFKLSSVAPWSAKKSSFPDTVATLSPTFIAIFDQTLEAESAQLEQLVGIGLRKALEFLVKDYAVAEHPGRETEIRSTPLAACIAQYVTDQNVAECAKRAAWLGNDETHYTRKWDTKDVNDLKLLVRLTVNWIENSILTTKYMTEMSAGKA